MPTVAPIVGAKALHRINLLAAISKIQQESPELPQELPELLAELAECPTDFQQEVTELQTELAEYPSEYQKLLAEFLQIPFEFQPKLSETQIRQVKDGESFIGENTKLVENGMALLTNAFTRMDEAVVIEGKEQELYSMLEEEHLRSLCGFWEVLLSVLSPNETVIKEKHIQIYCWYIVIALSKLTPRSIERPFILPMIKGFITPPIGWTDADAVNDPRPRAAIVCITETEFSDLPVATKTHIAMAIRAAQNNPNDTILKRLAATAAILSEMEPGEPAAAGITPTTAPDAADATAEETPATGTGETAEDAPVKRRRLPAGFKMIKPGQKPMTDEHIDLFFRKVLKHVVKIGHHTADEKKWEYADKEKTGTNQTRDHESFIFEYNGTRYRTFCYVNKKPEFCVKRQDRTGQGQPHYFHFIG